MNKLIKKPHLIFLLSIPIIMFIGILREESVLDINIHDTYFVIGYLPLSTLISMLFGIIGIGYWIMQKVNSQLSKWLYCTHVGLTFGGPLMVWVVTKFYRTEIMDYEFNINLTLIITLIVLVMILGQLIFPINIIYGLVKKKTSG
ncbi:hypothetical protein [Flammeovirga pacifica]|uniref:Uncharacterized protein n=1 Tax=Flammeovirga pacifica TaxID=915059 RepID=A0A1S1YSG2_FLAPC|nr:hypothetical protein [Flammeovirga pacifica]OHX63959.1 hypothetical protein NH26_20325 [Flammeovirga pacifica]